MKTLLNWFRKLVSGSPHFYIGGHERPYMMRWWLLPRNPWLNVYLHKFLRDDDDRALHDHPWWFISVMLRGRYVEIMDHTTNVRTAGTIAYRSATARHRITLDRDAGGNPIPCWTLIITGPKVRTWGFHCPKGFVPWHEFVDSTDNGNIGKGCGD